MCGQYAVFVVWKAQCEGKWNQTAIISVNCKVSICVFRPPNLKCFCPVMDRRTSWSESVGDRHPYN